MPSAQSATLNSLIPVSIPRESEATLTTSVKHLHIKIKQHGGWEEQRHRKYLFSVVIRLKSFQISWSLQDKNFTSFVFEQAVIHCWLGQGPKVAIFSEAKVRWMWSFGILHSKSSPTPGSQWRIFSEVSKMTLKSDFVLFGNWISVYQSSGWFCDMTALQIVPTSAAPSAFKRRDSDK